MYDLQFQVLQETCARSVHSTRDHQAQAVYAALSLYRRAYFQGWLGKMWSSLTRRSHRLFDLNNADVAACERRHAGMQTVPICQIQGSENRCDDFDAAFRPLQEHSRDRWLRIATARQLGTAMPPVTLIQIGDVYFVRDGHHRLSVARALGEQYIDAEVTIWQMTESAPMDIDTSAPLC